MSILMAGLIAAAATLSAVMEGAVLQLLTIGVFALIILANYGVLLIIFIFFILSGRQISTFLPRRDHGLFVETCMVIGELCRR
jgi:hypothetical protein